MEHAPVSHPQTVINPIAQIILAGVYLPSSSPLRILRSCPDVLERIFIHLKEAWKKQLIPGYDNLTINSLGNTYNWAIDTPPPPELLSRVALCRFRTSFIEFPPPKDLQCNMLPFRPNDLSTIPPEYRGYVPLIRYCTATSEGAVWYLTIDESRVNDYVPQRRPGIHVDGFLATPARCLMVPWWHRWGMGLGENLSGGIFHASSVSNSCKMWNVQIPRELSDVLQEGCDLEHLRGTLNQVAEPVIPSENSLYWMTDATPHESLPLKPGTYRQYFRVVVGPISAWWSKHSTANRLGVQPDCRIFDHSKFEEGAYIDYDHHVTSIPMHSDHNESTSQS